MSHIISKYLMLFAITLVVVTGAFLRLYRISDYLTFLGDEGRDVLVVKRMIVDRDIVFLGPTASVGGFFLGPMYYYFMAPFLFLSNLDPVGPAIMVGLFGIATIYLVYYVGSKMFHPAVGLSASLLYALSPVVIAYSRSSWNPNLVPFFSLLLVFFLWKFSIIQKNKYLIILGLLFGFGIQFHYLFSFVILFSLILVLFVRRSLVVIKDYLILFASSMIPLFPFGLFELRHSFPNTRSLLNFFTSGNETGFAATNFISTISDVFFRSFGRLIFRMPNYELWNGFPEIQITLTVTFIRIAIFSIIFFGIFSVIKYYNLKSGKKNKIIDLFIPLELNSLKAVFILYSWYLFSLILFGFYRKGIYDYYFGIFFAFPFISVSMVLWYVFRKYAKIISILIVLLLAYHNWLGRPFVYPPNRQLHQTKVIANGVVDLTQGNPYNFALDTATNSDHAYRYFLEIWDKKPVVIEQPAKDPERKTVTDQLIVICENPNCKPLGAKQWEIAGFGRAEIVEEKDIFPVKLLKLKHYESDENN